MRFKTTLKNKKTKNGKSSYIVFGLDQRNKKGYLIPCFKGECHHAGDFSYIKKKKKRERQKQDPASI